MKYKSYSEWFDGEIGESLDSLPEGAKDILQDITLGAWRASSELATNNYYKQRRHDLDKIDELEKELTKLKPIAELIHYPKCWDTMAYPTLLDAIREIGCNPESCSKDDLKNV